MSGISIVLLKYIHVYIGATNLESPMPVNGWLTKMSIQVN